VTRRPTSLEVERPANDLDRLSMSEIACTDDRSPLHRPRSRTQRLGRFDPYFRASTRMPSGRASPSGETGCEEHRNEKSRWRASGSDLSGLYAAISTCTGTTPSPYATPTLPTDETRCSCGVGHPMSVAEGASSTVWFCAPPPRRCVRGVWRDDVCDLCHARCDSAL